MFMALCLRTLWPFYNPCNNENGLDGRTAFPYSILRVVLMSLPFFRVGSMVDQCMLSLCSGDDGITATRSHGKE